MADRPILFSGPMVRALLDGRKTQTRRVLKPGKDRDFGCELAPSEIAGEVRAGNFRNSPYAPGDRLWARETWSHTGGGVFEIGQARMVGRDGVIYHADNSHPHAKWWPSIHMPREFSRLTLTVTDVRVQRLQDVSEEDAIAEGVQEPSLGRLGGALAQAAWSERQVFSRLWEHLHGVGSWDANPWVVAVNFETHRCNIDQMGAA